MRLQSRSVLAAAVSFGLVLALGLTGCTGATGPFSSAERPKIGFLVQNTQFDFTKELSDGYRAGARISGGVESTITGPATHDASQQVELFNEMITTTKAGVAVSSSSPQVLAPPLARAAASGIPLVAVGGRPARGSGVRLLVESDNYELGQMLAAEMIKRLPPEATGKIILGTNRPALPALDERAMGMRDEFTRKLPKVRVMGPFDVERDPPANLRAWRLLVAANPDAIAFLGTGDMDAFNLASVRSSTNGSWLAGAFSVDPRALQAVKSGQLCASVSPEHFLKSAGAAWLLAEHAKGARRLPEGWLVTPGLAITASNVDDIIRRQSSEENKLAGSKPHLDRITANPGQFLRPLATAW
jgi:ribose transport system substrate-binding protein